VGKRRGKCGLKGTATIPILTINNEQAPELRVTFLREICLRPIPAVRAIAQFLTSTTVPAKRIIVGISCAARLWDNRDESVWRSRIAD
jgi:hypothetical protein